MSGRGPAPEASGASCSAQSPPADALDAVAEDTPQAVLAGKVRGGGTGHIGGVDGAGSPNLGRAGRTRKRLAPPVETRTPPKP